MYIRTYMQFFYIYIYTCIDVQFILYVYHVCVQITCTVCSCIQVDLVLATVSCILPENTYKL